MYETADIFLTSELVLLIKVIRIGKVQSEVGQWLQKNLYKRLQLNY
jgi:hypothetical protein